MWWTMAQFMVVQTRTMELTEPEARTVFNQYLAHLKQDQWIRDGRVYTEAYTSHRFDMDMGDARDPKFAVLVCIEKLEEALRVAETGRPHIPDYNGPNT